MAWGKILFLCLAVWHDLEWLVETDLVSLKKWRSDIFHVIYPYNSFSVYTTFLLSMHYNNQKTLQFKFTNQILTLKHSTLQYTVSVCFVWNNFYKSAQNQHILKHPIVHLQTLWKNARNMTTVTAFNHLQNLYILNFFQPQGILTDSAMHSAWVCMGKKYLENSCFIN